MTKNQIDYWNMRETQQHNRNIEAEQVRTNKANERIKEQANSNTLQIGLGNLAETNRSNLARESENTRTNTENENIKRRANVINTYNAEIAKQNADTNRMNAGTNAINAQTAIGTLAEAQRTNMVNEAIKQGNLNELTRSNIANENIKRFTNATSAARSKNQSNVDIAQLEEQSKHNRVVEAETKRSNLIEEQLKAAGLLQTINRDEMNAKISLLQNMKPSVGARVNLGGMSYGK